jgi:hypothetical protein
MHRFLGIKGKDSIQMSSKFGGNGHKRDPTMIEMVLI